MKRRPFFRNIGAIAVYAFLGTTLSTFFVGGFLTLAGKLGLARQLPALSNMVFGSLISATDPGRKGPTPLALLVRLGRGFRCSGRHQTCGLPVLTVDALRTHTLFARQ